jgi:hypothetical protein
MSKLLDEYRLMLNMRLHVAELIAKIAELEAQVAAMPRWIELSEDPATWPPADRSYVLGRRKDGGYEVTRSAWMLEEWHLYFRWVRLPEYEETDNGVD